jgi:hypothetical protein
MADPVIVPCTKDAWTKVATAVTAGQVWLKDVRPYYRQAYVMTGNPAPTDLSKAVDFQGLVMEIKAQAAIDVYLYSGGSAGSVRVDL